LLEESTVASDAIGRIPFLVVAAALGVVAFGVVFLGFELKLGVYSLVLLVVPAAVAVVYASQYSRRSSEPGDSGADPDGPTAEPFDDPVEEADRMAGATAAEGSEPPSSESEKSP
jgi:hypothetical protein